MDIDTAEAAQFLAALTGDHTHTFQTFDDSGKDRRGMKRVLHGTFQRHASVLEDLNRKGAGVFVMVNRGDGMGRKAVNVTGCRALFLDLDGSPIEPVLAAPIRPRIVVESSPGKWHAYWPVVDLPPERFTGAQKQLAARFAGDLKVNDRPRVMRLPGFVHHKGAPFQSRLVECENAPVTWGEMAEAFGLTDRMTLSQRIPEGERNTTIFKLARSAAAKGVPEAAQLAKAHAVNATRCVVPLSDTEVAATVASAYRAPQTGAVTYPRALLDDPAFVSLGDDALTGDSVRLLLLLAYLRADGFNGGCVTLPHSELNTWFPGKKRFYRLRRMAVNSGLLTIAKTASRAMPRKGRGPKPGFFQLAIGPTSDPYSRNRIGPTGDPPEAFQSVAVEAHEAQGDASGPKRHRQTSTEASWASPRPE